VKKHIVKGTSILILLTLVFLTSGCSAKPTGTFISTEDSSITLVFSGSNVALYESGVQMQTGTFTTSAKTSRGDYLLELTWGESEYKERYWLSEDTNTLFNAHLTSDYEDGEVPEDFNTVGRVAFEKV
jgi:hypothetical protein